MAQQEPVSRLAYADNLKVALVAGVILAHATMAFAGLDGAWSWTSRRSASHC